MRAIILLLALACSTASAQIIQSPGENLGIDLTFYYGERSVGFGQPEGFESTALDERFGLALTSSGTASAITFTTTDYGKYPRYRLTSGTTVNAGCTFGNTAQAAGRGQFRCDGSEFITFMQVGIPIGYIAGNRAFFGIVTGNAAVPVNADPSALVNVAYFGFDSANTTWHVCSNDGAGTATCANLLLPIGQTGMFHFEFRQDAGASTLRYRMRRMDASGIDFQGSLGSDLPTSTVPLRPSTMISTGTTSGTAVIYEPKYMYVETP